MSILCYFKSQHGLPDPKGPVSSQIPLKSIDAANREVEKAFKEAEKSKKRGKYNRLLLYYIYIILIQSLLIFSPRYTAANRADIGRYACQHGTAAAARFFLESFK